ncbi:hypothetical protein QNO21_02900 [Microbacterium sp. zg-Y818]|uniref:hypothetical protein n=1 Tax=unclassified Microbacterium TaxID=2609290 RepID=UPI00214CF40B|nr:MULTISPECIES: hypothetical protein [unclassified Microbacterium]MCR2801731.1 hypothetical protein [Microbacterium sp. zg.Y818]WIM23002.1 hypothetical protein QNO21_02900 [Microbacterium sp. zg-Y818]
MLRPPARPARLRTRAAAAVASVILLVAGLVVAVPAQAVPTADADTSKGISAAPAARVASGIVKTADLSKFQPGNIISDAVFYNSGTMTEGQIQAFLNAQVPTCRSGYVCLKDKTDTTRAIPADPMCNAYAGGGVESAARILFKVAQACGINPQALLVMLQKEQSLVRDTWPLDSQYKIAMGQGCPDTAACDSRYFGFFNQVYGAAWQLKRYANPPGTSNYFTWYAPGKTWNVRYHPTVACGSSPVYIANQATAALYYYTPYQPNAAALRAGYGEGDGCSAYGNRNFYQYFTDWFGSTQGSASTLVKVGVDVWLVAGDRRYHMPSTVYAEYIRVFGTAVATSASYLNRFTDSGPVSLFVRNAASGEIAYVQNGRTHWFSSCSLVQLWGGDCAKRVDLTPEQFARFEAGPAMTDYSRTAVTGLYQRWAGGQLRPILDAESARLVNGGTLPFAAVMPASVQAGVPTGPTLFAPARALRIDGGAQVYLPTSDGRLIHVPSFAMIADYGIPGSTFRVVDRARTQGYTPAGSLTPVATCAGERFIAGSGRLTRLPQGAGGTLPATELDAATCAALALADTPAGGQIFIGAIGADAIHHLNGDALRHVPNVELLKELNGGAFPTILRVSPASLAALPQGLPYLRPGSMVRADGASTVYFVNGASLLHLPSWDLARALGLPATSTAVSAAQLATAGPSQGNLTPFVTCAAELYLAGDGGRSRVSSGDAEGNGISELAPSACAQIPIRATIDGPAFVTDGSRVAVAAAGGFLRLQTAEQARAANGGREPQPRRITAGLFASLPAPGALPAVGAVVRGVGDGTVYLLDGARRVALPNWGVGDDLGIRSRLTVRPAVEMALHPPKGTLSPLVGCEGRIYLASGGQLREVQRGAEGGLRVEPLDTATCRTLTFATAPTLAALRITDGTGPVYVAQEGSLVSTDTTFPAESVVRVSPGSLSVLRG